MRQGGILAISGAVIFALLWKFNESIGWQPVATASMLGGVALMVLSNAGILVAVRSFFSRVTASLVALGIFVVGAFSFGGIYPVSVAPAIFGFHHPV